MSQSRRRLVGLHGYAEIERINPELANPHFRPWLTKLSFPFNLDDPGPSIDFIEDAIEKHPRSWAIVTRNKAILKMAQAPVVDEGEETGTVSGSSSGSEAISGSESNEESSQLRLIVFLSLSARQWIIA